MTPKESQLKGFIDESKRKFLTKTAIAQRQSIKYFKDPFELVPVSQLAEIGDKFTRNEILSSNDMRSIIGFKPSPDPKADELRNKNLNPKEVQTSETTSTEPDNNVKGDNQNGEG
jgi:hypothetical protein